MSTCEVLVSGRSLSGVALGVDLARLMPLVLVASLGGSAGWTELLVLEFERTFELDLDVTDAP